MSADSIVEPVAPVRATPVLRTLVLADLADSTALVERLGDVSASEVMRRFDRCARDLMQAHGGHEIDKTDGFLVMFERPIQAVGFALALQRGLRDLSSTEALPLRARIGLHVGDVMVWDNAADDVALGAKRIEVEGLVKPIVARLASLALPGQILASAVACSLAQRSHAELGDCASRCRWLGHGRFRFKGVAEPVGVHEVGEDGLAPFRIPPWSSKAHREVPWWRRPSTVALETTVLLAAALGGAYLLLRTPQAIAFAERDWVVVGDLSNSTGEALFDEALDTAMRLGLEQSRYVNVVPPARVRQTLAMMKQPEARLDRQIAAEVAQREHARALVVPSISSYGKRLRITAELVNPQTSQTVLSDSVDADRNEDVLAATDQLVQRLRAHLGESLAQIESTGLPLERVTTTNLEALKAYSLGLRAVQHGDFSQSFNLLQHAIELDPDFALAYGRIAANYLSLGQPEMAREPLRKALSLSERLSNRERSYLGAHEAALRSPRDGIAAWKVYADLYPDDAAGTNNVGYFSFKDLNDCNQAVPYLKRAADSPHPLHIASMYTLALCELQLGQLDVALRDFAAARKGGMGARWIGEADALLASGDHAAAFRILDEPLRAGFSTTASPNSRFLHKLTVLADQGDFHTASALADAMQSDPDGAEYWSLLSARLSLWWVDNDLEAMRGELREAVPQLIAMAAHESSTRDFDHRLVLAELAVWAARVNLLDLAQRVTTLLDRDTQVAIHPARAKLAIWARAEIELRRGQARAAEQRLAGVNDHPYWSMREARARAAVAAQDSNTAQGIYRSLIADRGAALAELGTEAALGQTERIIAWNMSRLALARLLADSQPKQALTLLDAFIAQWPRANSDLPAILEAQALTASLRAAATSTK